MPDGTDIIVFVLFKSVQNLLVINFKAISSVQNVDQGTNKKSKKPLHGLDTITDLFKNKEF